MVVIATCIENFDLIDTTINTTQPVYINQVMAVSDNFYNSTYSSI